MYARFNKMMSNIKFYFIGLHIQHLRGTTQEVYFTPTFNKEEKKTTFFKTPERKMPCHVNVGELT